jgi:hypothetical protein
MITGPTVATSSAGGPGTVVYFTPMSQATSTSTTSTVSTGFSRHLHPRLTDPGTVLCGPNTAPFVFVQTSGGPLCFEGVGTYTLISHYVPLFFMSNSSGYRVWLHGPSGGGEWADCFDHGAAFQMLGRDGNGPLDDMQISSNPDACPNGGTATFCPLILVPVQMSIGVPGVSVTQCRQQATTYQSPPSMSINVNGTGARVWEHKSGKNPDCFDNNNAYSVTGLWDETPDDIQLTTNPDRC